MAKKFPAEDDYPDFTTHTSYTAKHLTKEMYVRLRDVKTSSGCTLDKCIQTGQPVHCSMLSSRNAVLVREVGKNC